MTKRIYFRDGFFRDRYRCVVDGGDTGCKTPSFHISDTFHHFDEKKDQAHEPRGRSSWKMECCLPCSIPPSQVPQLTLLIQFFTFSPRLQNSAHLPHPLVWHRRNMTEWNSIYKNSICGGIFQVLEGEKVFESSSRESNLSRLLVPVA